MEVSTALQRRIAIPVLVGAPPPKREDLPEDIRSLAELNAIEVSHARFDRDLDDLITALEAMVRRTPSIILVLVTMVAWMVAAYIFGPFFVGPNLDQDLQAPLIPYLASGTIAGLGISFALLRMRPDIRRVFLGLCAWCGSWPGEWWR